MVTNNITRMLEAKKIPYQAFELSAEKHSALETAQLLGVSPNIVYKTIVVTREKPGKPILAVIPAANIVEAKLLAAAVGEKKVKVPTQNESERLTGLQSGGISPLALINKGFQVVIDESARLHEFIHISGGQRGLNIRLPQKSLQELTNARYALVSVPGTDSE